MSLEQDLASLGSDADEIAETLRALGIKGDPSEPTSCAIANFLKSKGYKDVTASKGRTYADEYVINTPACVVVFIEDFDDLKHTDLINPDWIDPEDDE